MAEIFVTIFLVVFIGAAILFVAFSQYRKTLREAKNYERGLKRSEERRVGKECRL